MKIKYAVPEMEIKRFSSESIVTQSGIERVAEQINSGGMTVDGQTVDLNALVQIKF